MQGEKNLEFEAIAFLENGVGYAASYENNGLYEVNIHRGISRYIMVFPNENINGKRLYGSAVYCNSKIYFIPMLGEYISIYDIDRQEITQVSVPLPSAKYSFYKRKMKFCKGIYYNRYIYMIPFTYPGILKLDTKTNKVVVINSWIPKEGFFFRGGVCVDCAKIFVPSGINNIILEFNLKTEEATIHHIGKYNNGSMCIKKYRNCYVVAPRLAGSIIIWNPSEGKNYEIVDYPNEFKTEKILFSEIVCYANKLLFMPASANYALYMDEDMKTLTISSKWKLLDNSIVACMFETEEDYYFRESSNSTGECQHYKVRKTDGKIENYMFIIENGDELNKDFFDISKSQGEAMKETEGLKLENLLKLI